MDKTIRDGLYRCKSCNEVFARNPSQGLDDMKSMIDKFGGFGVIGQNHFPKIVLHACSQSEDIDCFGIAKFIGYRQYNEKKLKELA